MAGPNHSKIPESSSGGYLGLFSPETAFKPILNQIVAIEFDTFANPWDPPYAHVGINANSIISETTARWGIDNVESNLTTVVATVNYEAPYMFSVVVNTTNAASVSLSWVADLRGYLPDWIIVGFSGVTGGLVETHKILSWTFSFDMYSYYTK